MTWAPPEPLYAVFLFYGLLVCIHHCQSKGDHGSGTVTRRKNFRRIRRIRLDRSERCLFMDSSYSDRINDRMTKE